MAVSIDAIRAVADRIAARQGLDVVEVEFTGAGKARALRVFLEKDAAGREELKKRAAEDSTGLPTGVPVEALSGVTHEDCATFAADFGTVIDVEELIPGSAEYTLEVSSPGIERSLYKAADYERFAGFVAEVKTFQPVGGSKKHVGRMTFADGTVRLDLSAVKLKGRKKKGAEVPPETVIIPLKDIEKAHLVAEL